jgi:hypothetical protein
MHALIRLAPEAPGLLGLEIGARGSWSVGHQWSNLPRAAAWSAVRSRQRCQSCRETRVKLRQQNDAVLIAAG